MKEEKLYRVVPRHTASGVGSVFPAILQKEFDEVVWLEEVPPPSTASLDELEKEVTKWAKEYDRSYYTHLTQHSHKEPWEHIVRAYENFFKSLLAQKDERIKELIIFQGKVLAEEIKLRKELESHLTQLSNGRQEAIGFAEWVTEECWEVYDGSGRWVQMPGKRVVSSDSLYKIYLQSKSKKENV